MKLWQIVSVIEVVGYIVLSLLIWYRNVDGSGTVNTLENKFTLLAVLSAFCAFLFIVQTAWLIIQKSGLCRDNVNSCQSMFCIECSSLNISGGFFMFSYLCFKITNDFESINAITR